jgi:integrase
LAREATVRWDKNARAWRSDVGPRGENGRRRPVYFRKDAEGRELLETKAAERAARKLLQDHLDRRDEDEAATARGLADPSVEQLRLLWLSHVKRTGTIESYRVARSAIGQFARFTHQGGAYRDRRAAGLTATDLQRYLDARRDEGRKPHYLAKLAGVVQAMLNWAANPHPHRHPERLLPGGNPLRGMAAPKVPDSPERFAETRAVASFLRAWLGIARRRGRGGRQARSERLAALLLRVLVQTGCRPGEACKAQWGDVDWEAGRTAAGHAFGKITLPPERWKMGRKTGKSRTVYLTPALTRALRRESLRLDRHPTHLFHHIRRRRAEGEEEASESEPWTSAALAARVRKVRKLAIAAGADLEDAGPNRIVNYLWRHTAASRALMRGMDPVTVAALLGTSPEMLRKHYGHILDSHLARAAEALAGARRPAPGGA